MEERGDMKDCQEGNHVEDPDTRGERKSTQFAASRGTDLWWPVGMSGP